MDWAGWRCCWRRAKPLREKRLLAWRRLKWSCTRNSQQQLQRLHLTGGSEGLMELVPQGRRQCCSAPSNLNPNAPVSGFPTAHQVGLVLALEVEANAACARSMREVPWWHHAPYLHVVSVSSLLCWTHNLQFPSSCPCKRRQHSRHLQRGSPAYLDCATPCTPAFQTTNQYPSAFSPGKAVCSPPNKHRRVCGGSKRDRARRTPPISYCPLPGSSPWALPSSPVIAKLMLGDPWSTSEQRDAKIESESPASKQSILVDQVAVT